MRPGVVTFLGVIGLLLTVLSCILLHLGSTPVPGSLLIIGESKTDQEIRAAQSTMQQKTKIGFASSESQRSPSSLR